MKKLLLFLISVLSATALAIYLMKHPDSDPTEELQKDEDSNL